MNLKGLKKFWHWRPKIKKRRFRIAVRPECEKYWTTLYYGARGSGKTLHQAKECLKILKYLKNLYLKKPDLKQAILFTNQKFSDKIEKLYPEYLYYWADADALKNCPRKNCWRGKKEHRLHGAYVIIDDISTLLPPDEWRNVPLWFRKTFFQARHFGIRILANAQDPFAIDVNFRRCVDVAYKFSKLFGTKDPDETKPRLKYIFGFYRRRKINAMTLWQYGDLDEQTIRMLMINKEQENEQLKKMGKEFDIVLTDNWRGSYHLFRKKHCEIYDTLQDIPEYKPKGFLHSELHCIDPKHNHTDPKALNYCKFKKIDHQLI